MGVSRRWFTKADVKYFKSGALRTITNITKSMVNWKKFLYRCISKILFIDTEQFSKMHILSQVFLKDFFDRLGNIYLRNEFLWKILFIYSATSSTRMIHLKVQIHTYIYTRTYVHTYLPTYLPTYIHTYIHTYIYIHTYRGIIWKGGK